MATNNNTADISAKTFPGVYTSITDKSFIQPQTSRFSVGLLGVARKGPFNAPIAIGSLRDFIFNFGQPLTGNFFLSTAVGILADLTDGMQVVRVGGQYTPVASVQASGVSGGTTLTSSTNRAQIFSPASAPYGQGKNVFINVKQTGLPSTVNVQVTSASSGTISIAGNGVLAATYTGADVSYSNLSDAAFVAEGALIAYTYGTNSSNQTDQAVTSAGTAVGTKNAFQFSVSGNYSAISAGDLLKLKQTGKNSTREVRVRQTTPDGTVYLETTDLPDVGYQALPLQDTYDNAQVFKATGTVAYLYLNAISAGDWANGTDPSTGLYVKVRPGSAAGTKKFEVYENSALVETIDNLTNIATDSNFYLTRINGFSQYITASTYFNPPNTLLAPANTANGWNPAPTLPMPFGNINASGVPTLPTPWATGGGFQNGFNGENAQNSDFVGTYDPIQDAFSGVKCFEDSANIQVDAICAPGLTDAISTIAIHQEMARVARVVNAVALIDVPSGLNLRSAIDWHNGVGPYTGRGRLDTPNAAVYWNWFTMVDPFTGNTITVPPTIGALRCLAFTFDADKPWYAAAGDTRGLIEEAITVQYPRVSDDLKQASYGNGQSINGIFYDRKQIKLYGERTMQVAESQLSVVHNVILINTIVDNLASIGRQFVFEPNDPELLTRINLAFSQYLDTVKNERGLEGYSLIVDTSNNTAATRNLREVIVDLAVIPIETAERIFINATVNASGAVLNSAASAPVQ